MAEPALPRGMDLMNGLITIADEDRTILARIFVGDVLASRVGRPCNLASL